MEQQWWLRLIGEGCVPTNNPSLTPSTNLRFTGMFAYLKFQSKASPSPWTSWSAWKWRFACCSSDSVVCCMHWLRSHTCQDATHKIWFDFLNSLGDKAAEIPALVPTVRAPRFHRLCRYCFMYEHHSLLAQLWVKTSTVLRRTLILSGWLVWCALNWPRDELAAGNGRVLFSSSAKCMNKW
jgi:hypothetical protein